MSRLFGPMRQVGIVVRDIEKAMRHWVEVCGVGPWFYAEPMDEFRYKRRSYDLKVSIAVANSGDVQLELISATQRCTEPLQGLPRRRPRGNAALVELAGELS